MVEILVDRFDAPACADASPVASMGKTGPEGSEVIRAYTADAECLDSLVDGMTTIGFKKNDAGVFAFQNSRGGSETVTIKRTPDRKSGGIEWEDINP
ncbi:hypothetical protein [Erythrobacter sp. JK5]|uniref:hypothetical protein n=1 Tax=Erythrobacter sp. JK5 TaxID=2829500 RepID=UPI001BAD98F4|nr:hypothetical protein [Erythrobacter sp. JK5]QUL38817.1 hypothetical protein KDC96_05455 [Erythrobacter sp. JK5]